MEMWVIQWCLSIAPPPILRFPKQLFRQQKLLVLRKLRRASVKYPTLYLWTALSLLRTFLSIPPASWLHRGPRRTQLLAAATTFMMEAAISGRMEDTSLDQEDSLRAGVHPRAIVVKLKVLASMSTGPGYHTGIVRGQKNTTTTSNLSPFSPLLADYINLSMQNLHFADSNFLLYIICWFVAKFQVNFECWKVDF